MNDILHTSDPPPRADQPSLVYVLGTSDADAAYFDASHAALLHARVASASDELTPGLYNITWASATKAVFRHLNAEGTAKYLNRGAHCFPIQEYSDALLRAFLLGARVADYRERSAIIVAICPLVIDLPHHAGGRLHEASFLTEKGERLDLTVDKMGFTADGRARIICTPLVSATPCGLVKNSRLECISSNNHPPLLTTPLTTQVVDVFLRNRLASRLHVNRHLLNRLYGPLAAYSHPRLDATQLHRVRMADGTVRALDAPASAVVLQYLHDNQLDCPAFAVDAPPGSGKTLLLAAMAIHYHTEQEYGNNALQLLLAPTDGGVRNVARALQAQHTGTASILQLMDPERAEHSAYSAFGLPDNSPARARLDALQRRLARTTSARKARTLRRRIGRAYADAPHACGPQDILISTFKVLLGWMTRLAADCALIQQLQQRVTRIAVDDANQLTEADLNAIILMFPNAKIALLGDSKQLLPSSYRRGDIASWLSATSALEVVKRKKNIPVIRMTTVYRSRLIAHYSAAFYANSLRSAAREPENGVKLSDIFPGRRSNLVFVNIGPSGARSCGRQLINDAECAALERIVLLLGNVGVDHTNVLVVSHYATQAKFVATRLPLKCEVVEADEAQGREARVVIVLTTQDATSARSRKLTCPNRCNMLASRHTEALIVLGSPGGLQGTPWQRLLASHFTQVPFGRRCRPQPTNSRYRAE